MTEEELKIWFWYKLNSCYQVKYEDDPYNIYYFYDKTIERYNKLCILNNIDIKYSKRIKGKLIFYKNTKSKILYCSSDIFRVLEKDLNYMFDEIQIFVDEILKDNIDFELYHSDFIPIERYH